VLVSVCLSVGGKDGSPRALLDDREHGQAERATISRAHSGGGYVLFSWQNVTCTDPTTAAAILSAVDVSPCFWVLRHRRSERCGARQDIRRKWSDRS
jgi:hypothetical protein